MVWWGKEGHWKFYFVYAKYQGAHGEKSPFLFYHWNQKSKIDTLLL